MVNDNRMVDLYNPDDITDEMRNDWRIEQDGCLSTLKTVLTSFKETSDRLEEVKKEGETWRWRIETVLENLMNYAAPEEATKEVSIVYWTHPSLAGPVKNSFLRYFGVTLKPEPKGVEFPCRECKKFNTYECRSWKEVNTKKRTCQECKRKEYEQRR